VGDPVPVPPGTVTTYPQTAPPIGLSGCTFVCRVTLDHYPAATSKPLSWAGISLFVQRHQVPVVLGWLILVHFVVQLVWLKLDTYDVLRVPDSYAHYNALFQLYKSFEHDGILALLTNLREMMSSHYSVLGHLPAVLVTALFEPTPLVFRAANVVYLVILVVSVYQLGRLCLNRKAGLLAATLVCLTPAVYGGWRTTGVDFPAMCLTAAAMAQLIRAQGFARLGASAGFGVVAGLAALAKTQSLFFLFGPAVFLLARSIYAGVKQHDSIAIKRAAMGGGVAVATLLASTAFYWAGRLSFLADVMRIHATGQGMFHYEGDISVMGGVKLYIQTFPLLVTGLLTVTLLATSVLFWRNSRHRWVILLWIVLPILLHILLKVRHHRYLLPLVPAVAVMVGVGLCAIRPRLRGVVTAVVGTAATVMWLGCSFSAGVQQGDAHSRVLWASTRLNLSKPDSLLGFVSACGGCIYSGLPTASRGQPFYPPAVRLARWLDRRHPGGRGALLLFDGEPNLGQLVVTTQSKLPALHFGIAEVQHQLREFERRKDLQLYFLTSGQMPYRVPHWRPVHTIQGPPAPAGVWEKYRRLVVWRQERRATAEDD